MGGGGAKNGETTPQIPAMPDCLPHAGYLCVSDRHVSLPVVYFSHLGSYEKRRAGNNSTSSYSVGPNPCQSSLPSTSLRKMGRGEIVED